MRCRRELIFDVGMHRGEDAAYYLALGYSVIGFEANPDLARHCRNRFEAETADGRFTLVEGAIAEPGQATVTFYQHQFSEFGTTRPQWDARNAPLGGSRRLEVSAVDFQACLRTFDVPYFLKIDIEGADRICLDALRACAGRPAYLSLESDKADFDAVIDEFDILRSLGYDRYAVVQQAGIGHIERATRLDGTKVAYTFEPSTSGPFGPDIGPWLTYDQALERYTSIFRAYRLLGDHSWVRRSRLRRAVLNRAQGALRKPLPGWYDTHARLAD